MLASILSIFLSVQAAPRVDAAAEEYVLTFQIRPDALQSTVDLIASISEPRKMRIEEPMTIEQITKSEYGTTFKIAAPVRRANRGATDILDAGTWVNLPGLPEWRFKELVAIPSTVDLAAFACLKMGVCGPKTIDSIEQLNRASIETLQLRRVFKLPYSASVVSVRLKPGMEKRAAQIVESLKADPAVERAEISKPFQLVPMMEEAVLSSGVCAADGQQPAPSRVPGLGWLKMLPAPSQKTIVAILDSGVPLDDSRFNFWQNATEKNGRTGVDDDGNHFDDDIIGTDVLRASEGGGFPLDDLELADYRNHGTHVAGISSGRTYAADQQSRIDERLELMIVKVADSNARVWAGAAADGVAYAVSKGANVINMSFAGDFSPATQWVMKNAPTVLFVTAAGNSLTLPLDVGSSAVYPARFASELPNVIAVAASDAASSLACFSNFGSAVDLAAPGVRVTSTFKMGIGALSGTSQATPWVSLAAALLYSIGVDKPDSIRMRILHTVDFNPGLIGKVRSEGTLNIEKALAVSDDLIVTSDGTFHRGRLQTPLSAPTSCGSAEARVTRIVFDPTADAEHRARIILVGSTAPCVTSVPFPFISLRENGIDAPVDFLSANIREIIPRWR